jgi:hypothetical protein
MPDLQVRLEVPQATGITVDVVLLDTSCDENFAIELK